MSQSVSGFPWSKRSELAALRVAEDGLTDVEIAAEAKISQRTLERWKQNPDFAARVAEHVAGMREAIRAQGIANRQNRVEALNERWQQLLDVIRARGQDPALANVPGGTTGHIVASPMVIKVMEAADLDDDGVSMSPTKESRIVYEYSIDAALLKELRAHEQQAAQELGQWVEKSRVDGSHIIREYVGVPLDDV